MWETAIYEVQAGAYQFAAVLPPDF